MDSASKENRQLQSWKTPPTFRPTFPPVREYTRAYTGDRWPLATVPGGRTARVTPRKSKGKCKDRYPLLGRS